MSPTTYKSPLSSISTTSRSAALAQVEDRNRAKGLTESSYNKMMGGQSGGQMDGLLQSFLAARKGAADIEMESETKKTGMVEAADIRRKILDLELEPPSGERDRMLAVLRSKLAGIR